MHSPLQSFLPLLPLRPSSFLVSAVTLRLVYVSLVHVIIQRKLADTVMPVCPETITPFLKEIMTGLQEEGRNRHCQRSKERLKLLSPSLQGSSQGQSDMVIPVSSMAPGLVSKRSLEPQPLAS
ncbi:MAG: hypothetical protein FRX48_08881 [Lasallia pustulata]|uniref:Uncharacterized protein n=1 Tax=Lasallia pustulata TaxID=136370 RepID=A0A5M8PE33_9LECA|nr:MAG: hypothetical protein FRX48_08881 [Lasallia pustulata]